MTEFVQVRRVDLFAEDFLFALGEIPKIFQKQDDLGRQGHIAFFRKFRAGEQSQCAAA